MRVVPPMLRMLVHYAILMQKDSSLMAIVVSVLRVGLMTVLMKYARNVIQLVLAFLEIIIVAQLSYPV